MNFLNVLVSSSRAVNANRHIIGAIGLIIVTFISQFFWVNDNNFYIAIFLTPSLVIIAAACLQGPSYYNVNSKWIWAGFLMPFVFMIYMPINVLVDRFRDNELSFRQKSCWVIKSFVETIPQYPNLVGIFFAYIEKSELERKPVNFYTVEECMLNYICQGFPNRKVI